MRHVSPCLSPIPTMHLTRTAPQVTETGVVTCILALLWRVRATGATGIDRETAWVCRSGATSGILEALATKRFATQSFLSLRDFRTGFETTTVCRFAEWRDRKAQPHSRSRAISLTSAFWSIRPTDMTERSKSSRKQKWSTPSNIGPHRRMRHPSNVDRPSDGWSQRGRRG